MEGVEGGSEEEGGSEGRGREESRGCAIAEHRGRPGHAEQHDQAVGQQAQQAGRQKTGRHLVSLEQRICQRLPQQHAICQVLEACGAAGAVVKPD